MPPSPVRRSARGALPPTKPPPPTSNSSASSLSSARQDRNTRAGNGEQKSATPHSLSSEEVSEPPRRSQRAQPAKDENITAQDDNVDEAAVDDEEVTRCICGQQEYPGPPLSEAFSATDAQGDDAGGLFIQCDGCSVWQHGGCVGIIEESQSPDKYYCEECRPKLHDQHTDTRGQHYSNYLPLHPQAKRKGSVSKSDKDAKREREATNPRASVDPSSGRRRGTMRSKEHDDEEEQLRIALEESKREVDGSGKGRRNGKRGRDESEDTKPGVKRQRTFSESITSMSRTATVDQEDESEEETASGSRGKKARAEAVQSLRQAELREKEKERERARSEAAGRRQERAGRRRADESEPLEETPRPANSARASPPPSSQPPSPPGFAAPDKLPQKKGGPGKKTKKLGNNQYTKNRDLSAQPTTSSPHSKKRQLGTNGASSGDEQLPNGDSHPTNTSNSTNKNSPGAQENGIGHSTGKGPGKFSKGKNKLLNGLAARQPIDLADLSIADMERAMDGMSAFMQKAQLDMAGAGAVTPPGPGLDGTLGGAVQPPAPGPTSGGVERPFERMSSMEMADTLSRNIERWKRRFGQQGQVPTG